MSAAPRSLFFRQNSRALAASRSASDLDHESARGVQKDESPGASSSASSLPRSAVPRSTRKKLLKSSAHARSNSRAIRRDLTLASPFGSQELRDACEEKGLDATGLKAVLLERLEKSLASDADADADAAGGDDDAPAENDDDLEDVPDDDAPAAAATAGDDDLVDPDDAPATENPASAAAPATNAGANDAAGVSLEPKTKAAQTPERLAATEAARAALVAAIEEDIEKRKHRAERFGMPFVLSELDETRLRCAKEGKLMPGSAEEAATRREAKARGRAERKQKKRESGGRGQGQGQGQGQGGAGAEAKAKAKGDACRNCGKKGHWARDCWAPGGGKEGQGGGRGGEKRSKPETAPDRATGDDAERKKARAERFGTGETLRALDPEFEAKLAARAARFAEDAP